MGTNFYWLAPPLDCPHCHGKIELDFVNGGLRVPSEDEDSAPSSRRAEHIGKRSAAGLYCYDCDLTLIVGGVHSSGSSQHQACPKCGAKPPDFSKLDRGAAAVELGFAKPEPERPKGVYTAASFSWALEPDGGEGVRAILGRNLKAKIVVDEYGRTYTGAEFLSMLRSNCPIEFRHIGVSFS